ADAASTAEPVLRNFLREKASTMRSYCFAFIVFRVTKSVNRCSVYQIYSYIHRVLNRHCSHLHIHSNCRSSETDTRDRQGNIIEYYRTSLFLCPFIQLGPFDLFAWQLLWVGGLFIGQRFQENKAL